VRGTLPPRRPYANAREPGVREVDVPAAAR